MKGESADYPRRVIHYDAKESLDPALEGRTASDLELRVAQRTQELQAANAQLFQKVSELIGAQHDLVQAEKMAMAGKLSGAFAHEVNNPLTVVCSSLELLRETIVGFEKLWGDMALLSPSQRTQLEKAATASMQESGELINDALVSAHRLGDLVVALTRMANPLPPARHGKTDLCRVVREMFGESATQSGSGQVCWIPCEELEVRRALTNLSSIFASSEVSAADSTFSAYAKLTEERPTVILSDLNLMLSPRERHSLFDPRLETDSSQETIRLNLARAETYFWLRDVGAEMIQEGEPGLTIRVLFPSWNSDSSG